MWGAGAFFCAFSVLATSPARAQVFSSEFFSDPVSEGWTQVLQYCAPQTWNEDGWYHQQLDLEACATGPGGGRDVYRRSIQAFNGTANFFMEFRLGTNGNRSEVPFGAPTVLALGNSFGVLYHITAARDLSQFFRDADLPIWFTEVELAAPHTYRIELYEDWYIYYIDGSAIDEGLPEGPFPVRDSEIVWQGQSWYLPCENAWDYIRYGVIPENASGDFDADAAIGLPDFYFFQECLTNERLGINGGPDNDSGPGCRFADFDADSDVDLLDIAEFQLLFTGP